MADRSRSPSVTRAAHILRLLAQNHSPLTVTAIARETQLPRASVQGICEALIHDRMLTQGADGCVWLGPRLAELAATRRLTRQHALRFGFLLPSLENGYYTAMLAAARTELQITGGEVLVHHAHDDGRLQREQWQRLLDDDADIILIDAVDAASHEAQIAESRRRGVPVIAIGSRIDDVDVSVTSDNTQAGILAGRALAQALPERAQIAVIDGLRKNANADRISGFFDAVRDYPQLEVIDVLACERDTVDAGFTGAHRLLDANPDIAGIFTVCDPLAFGVAAALRERGSAAVVSTVDGRADAVRQIRDGGPIIATAAQDPVRIIRTALDIGRELHEGNRPLQRAVQLPVRVVTQANVEGYAPWG